MPAVRSGGGADQARAKPRSDAYVGLLGLSLLALSAAMLFAFLNWQGIAEKPKPVQVAPAGGGARPAAPAGGPPVNPAVPGQPAAPAPPGVQQQPNQPAAPPDGKAPPPAPAPQKK